MEKLTGERRHKLRLGDIYEIPLPNGKKAYGRLYKEYTLAIYNKICLSYEELPEQEEYQFFVGVYKDLLQDGIWKVVGSRKFDKEEAWSPPQCVIDAITGIGSLYDKGKIIPCSYNECKDLEIASVWDRNHLIDRLMGDNKWGKELGRPKDPEEK